MKRFDWLNIARLQDDEYGVYAIWGKNLCIYVGKAEKQSIKKRLLQHYSGSHNQYLSMWIASTHTLWFDYNVINNIHAINMHEKRKILQLAPLTNVMLIKKEKKNGKYTPSL